MVSRANQIEEAVNLKQKIAELADVNDSEFIFQDTSPPARWETVYATDTGEAIRVKRRRLESVLMKTRTDGTPSFTTRKELVPEYQRGTTLCLFAEGSPEYETIVALGIANPVCNARHLSNEVTREIHAEHKHPTRIRIYRRHIETAEREKMRQDQAAQTAAMLEMAKAARGK